MFRTTMLVLLLLLAAHAAAANAPPAGPAAVAAAPGVGFGLDVTPGGAPSGSPVVLEARLARPGDPVDGPPLRWMVAASAGAPVRVAWEFAYDWEIIPGVWTLKVFNEDAEIASAEFDVSRAPAATAEAKAAPGKPGVKVQAQPARDTGHAAQSKPKPGAANIPNADRVDGERPAPSMPAPDARAPAAPGASSQAAPKAAAPPAPPAPSQAEPRGAGQARAPAQTPKPPRQAARIVDGPQERTLHVLVGGVYSEEARALWVTVFLGKQGVKACVREERSGQRKLWAVITGWRDTPEEARALKLEQAQAVGDIFLRAMTAAELNQGLVCP